MLPVKGNLFLIAVLSVIVLFGCNTGFDLKKMQGINKKISNVKGVLKSTININTQSHGSDKKIVTYIISAQVDEFPNGNIENDKLVLDMVDTLLVNDAKADSVDFIKVSLIKELNRGIVKANKGISITKTPSTWKQLIGIPKKEMQ